MLNHARGCGEVREKGDKGRSLDGTKEMLDEVGKEKDEGWMDERNRSKTNSN